MPIKLPVSGPPYSVDDEGPLRVLENIEKRTAFHYGSDFFVENNTWNYLVKDEIVKLTITKGSDDKTITNYEETSRKKVLDPDNWKEETKTLST